MNRADLRARRNEAIKTGKVYSNTINEDMPFNEATDWTYRDFQDATQILINRLNQLQVACNTDNPGPEQAKLMQKVANMTKVYSDKIIKVFRNDEPVKQMDDPDTNDGIVIEKEQVRELISLMQSALLNVEIPTGSDYTENKLILHFDGTTVAGYSVSSMLDLHKFGTQISCSITTEDKADTNIRTTTNYDNIENDPQQIFELIKKNFKRFDDTHPEPTADRDLVGVESKNIRYTVPIDLEVLKIL